MTRTGRTGRLRGLRRWLRDNGLSLTFGAAFLATLIAQAVAGRADLNNQLHADGQESLSFGAYLTSADFAVDVTENWQSEYFQFFLYVMATIWLFQRGSPESKPLGRSGLETERQQYLGPHARPDSPGPARARGGWRRALYSSSLGLVMGLLFVLTWLAQFVSGRSAYNAQQLREFHAPIGWGEYARSADFWNRTLQNWQSEMLALASLAILSVYLRQRGSPESKPVGAPHTAPSATGTEG